MEISCTLTFAADKHSIDKMKQLIGKIDSVIASQVKEKNKEKPAQDLELEADKQGNSHDCSPSPKVMKFDLIGSDVDHDPVLHEVWVSLDACTILRNSEREIVPGWDKLNDLIHKRICTINFHH